jgi:hypothetical protein
MQDMSVNYNTKLIRDVNFTSWVYGDYFLPMGSSTYRVL